MSPKADYYNGQHYADPTAYKGMQNTVQEEAELTQLIRVVKYIVSKAGFELEGRIVLRNKNSGHIYK